MKLNLLLLDKKFRYVSTLHEICQSEVCLFCVVDTITPKRKLEAFYKILGQIRQRKVCFSVCQRLSVNSITQTFDQYSRIMRVYLIY